jgi:acyl-coenzyme A thioesterase PaaI-like protein
VHGGLVAAALDEACGLLATWYRFPTVTGRLFVHYRRPVSINTELLIRARLVGEHARRIQSRGARRWRRDPRPAPRRVRARAAGALSAHA